MEHYSQKFSNQWEHQTLLFHWTMPKNTSSIENWEWVGAATANTSLAPNLAPWWWPLQAHPQSWSHKFIICSISWKTFHQHCLSTLQTPSTVCTILDLIQNLSMKRVYGMPSTATLRSVLKYINLARTKPQSSESRGKGKQHWLKWWKLLWRLFL